MGVDQRTGQYMIHDSGVIKFARTIMRMPEPDKFNKEELAKIAAWDMHVPREMEVVFKDKSEGAQEAAKDKATMSRQVYIKASDIQQSGMTHGCPRCDHQLR